MSSNKITGLPAVALAAVLWGTVGVTTKTIYQLGPTNALSIGFFRLAFSVPAMLLLYRAVYGVPAGKPQSKRDLGIMLILGAAMALYQVCIFGAIPKVGVAIATLIALCVAPIIVALLSGWLLNEKLTGRVLLALLLAIIGTGLLVGWQGVNVNGEQGQLRSGIVLALGAALSYGVVTICGRMLSGRYTALYPITVGFAAGAILLFPFALAGGLTLDYPPAGWLLLLYLGVVPTAIGYWLFLYGLRWLPATVASIVTLLEPLTATILASLLFGERLAPAGVVAAGLLLTSMIILAGNHKKG